MTMTRNIKYFCEWVGRGGTTHYSVDTWDDVAKWSWNLVKDYKFDENTTSQVKSYPNYKGQHYYGS